MGDSGSPTEPHSEVTVIRPMRPTDVPAVVALSIDTGMFAEEAAAFIRAAAEDTLAKRRPGSWVVDERDDRVHGVAFIEPREATDRVWAVTMLAVAPAVQGTGLGRRLLDHVEAHLRSTAQRLLVIETSGTARYDGTRSFYARCGYLEVARVPPYYTDGDDMVLFLKDLREGTGGGG